MRFLLISFFCLMVGGAQAQTVRILVQRSPLAGSQYYETAILWNDMKAGDALRLVREPDNVHDSRAVRVEWQGHKLGYLPRAENRAVADEMDRDARLEARIGAMVPHKNPWRRVLIDVFVAF